MEGSNSGGHGGRADQCFARNDQEGLSASVTVAHALMRAASRLIATLRSGRPSIETSGANHRFLWSAGLLAQKPAPSGARQATKNDGLSHVCCDAQRRMNMPNG